MPLKDVPGANEPFPELSNTPEPPLREIELATLDSISEGLVADRANAQYTGERLVGGSPSGSPSPGATSSVQASPVQASPVQASPVQSAPVQQAAGQLRVPKPPAPGSAAIAGAPPVPKIAGELVGQGQAPSAPEPARSQVAQSAAGQAQLRFPQFQGHQFQASQFQAPPFHAPQFQASRLQSPQLQGCAPAGTTHLSAARPPLVTLRGCGHWPAR